MRRADARLLVVLVVGVAWAGVLAVPFQFDDYPTILRDDATRDAHELAWRIFHGVRPLLRASFFADHAMWGFETFGFHLTNLALHLVTTLGVFALARTRLADDAAAFAAALLFALQPANAETVAYVSGRSTGMATALLVGALLAHDLARRSDARWRIAEIALFVLACFAKEVALIYPAIAWWWDLTGPKPADSTDGSDAGTAVKHWGPGLIVPVVVVGMLAGLSRYRELAGYSLAMRGPIESLAVNARAVPVMVSLWVRPWALSVDHGFDARGSGGAIAAGALAVLGAVIAAFALRRRAPLAALAIGWALLALAPTNSFIAKSDPVTEKPLYLAWIGVAIFLASILPRRVTPAVLAVMAAGVVLRVAMWQEPPLLWLDAVSKAPAHARGWNNLGMALHLDHDDRRAIVAFRRAVALDPSDAVARRNLARLEARGM